MRALIVIGLVAASTAAGAQDTPRVVTLAEVEANRPALAGDIVRVESAVVFNFAQDRGGSVRDASGGAKLTDEGITPKTIYHLERFCKGFSPSPPKPECRGTLTFKVTLREEHRGGFTIREAEFTPEK